MKNTTTATITTIADLATILASAKQRGTYATITYEKPLDTKSDLRVNATDGSGLKLDKSRPVPFRRGVVKYHFGQDYEKKAKQVFGEDYEVQAKSYKQVIVPYVMYYNTSTDNYTLSYIKENATYELIATEEEKEYFAHFAPKPKSDSSPIKYRTLSVKYITRVAFDGKELLVDIPNVSIKRIA